MRVYWLILVGVGLCCGSSAVWAETTTGLTRGTIHVVLDLYDLFPTAAVRDAQSPSRTESYSGDVSKPAIFLHPPAGEAKVATLTYALNLPEIGDDEGLYFLFDQGLRDGWLRATDPADIDGVRFQVGVNDEILHDEHWREEGWGSRIVDLSPWAGRDINLTLGVHRNENANADWALVGDPHVIRALRRGVTGAADGLPVNAQINHASAQPGDLEATDDGALRVTASGDVLLRGGLSGEGEYLMLAEVVAPETAEIALQDLRFQPQSRAFTVVRQATQAAQPDASTWLRLPVRLDQEERQEAMLRYSGPAGLEVRQWLLLQYPTQVAVGAVATEEGLIHHGELFTVAARVINRSRAAVPASASVSLSLPGILELQDDAEQWVTLGPAPSETVARWRVRASTDTAYAVVGARIDDGPATDTLVRVVPTPPPITREAPQMGRTVRLSNLATVENATARLALVGDQYGLHYGLLDGWDGRAWQRLAVMPHLGHLVVAGDDGPYQVPIRYTEAMRGQDGLLLKGITIDEADVSWTAAILLFAQADTMRCSFSVQADRSVNLLSWHGPTLLVGETSFGEAKDFALLPGLEYLEADEVSSSTRDIWWPQSERSVPHPLRITAPVAAVDAGGFITAMGWNPRDPWTQGQNHPSVLFSSPNRLQGQRNHLMGLWTPKVPDHVPEGGLSADRPFRLTANTPMSLQVRLWVEPKPAQVFDSIRWWLTSFGWPGFVFRPERAEEYLVLARHALLNVVWSESAKGWSHAVGWPPMPIAGQATLNLLTGWLTQDREERQALHRQADLVIANIVGGNPGGLASGAGAHVMRGELPFYAGHVSSGVLAMEQRARALLRGMTEEGVWTFEGDTGDKLRDALGTTGETASGLCDRNTWDILRAARLGRDPELLQGAKRALAGLERFRVPRGAQTWECPLHVPDILSSAHMTRVYVEAHELFGDPAYLELARYWAGTGLPFVYFWYELPIPQMPYATIPIFGATHFIASWLGVPVQWCGLEYSYALFQLARHDPDGPWERLALGILHSAVEQTYTDGPTKGTLPDAWNLLTNQPQPVDITPMSVLANVFAAMGHDPGIKFAHAPPFHLASGAQIVMDSMLLQGDPPSLNGFALEWLEGATTYTLLDGLETAPEKVTFGNTTATGVEEEKNLSETANGWWFDEQRRWLVLKVTHGEKSVDVRLGPAVP